ncbi:MAG: peptidase M48 [Paludibacter sp. 47-17]|jgi:STE24 endopeptidase|nr:MAG: peptidase M48 [Paludibacter sp. 47-17]
MHTLLLALILVILVAEYGLNRWLSVLNVRNSRIPLPSELSGIYDPESYSRQQEYFRTNVKFGTLSATFNLLLIAGMYVAGGFGWLDTWLLPVTDNEILRSLLFFGVLFIVSDLLNLPFDYYDTFVIEAKFGFNKTTPGLFLLDKLKSTLLMIVLGGGLLALIVWIYLLTSTYFWLLAFGVLTFFGLVMSMFYSEWIVPLFNKQTPLEAGELRTAISSFAEKAGFKIDNIFVIDGSRRSTKANAYFSGLGPRKRIVLYDTLIAQMTIDEIVAVLAHEIGHYKHRHVLKGLLLSLPFNLLLFYLLGLTLKSDLPAMAAGGTAASFHVNALVFFTIYTPVSMVFDLLGNLFSRRHEYQADAFAARYGYSDALVSSLKKLSATSLSNLMPHPLYVFFNYSHPTLYQRIKKIAA